MAGGLGARLKPFTHIIPKPLLPIGEKSIVEIIIEKLRSHGFNDIIIATNYKSNLFESYFGNGSSLEVNITYSKEDKKLGTVGPLSLMKDKLNEDFLVLNGDILTNLDFKKLKEFHINSNSDLTVVTKKIQTPLHYGIVESNEENITEIKEKPILESEILAGIYFINSKVLSYLPTNEYYDMPNFIRDLIKKGKKISKFELTDYWLDIGSIENYNKANEDIEKGFL